MLLLQTRSIYILLNNLFAANNASQLLLQVTEPPRRLRITSLHRRPTNQRHERSHTKEKPFECPECTRCFARRDLLLRHQQELHMTTIHLRDQEIAEKVQAVQLEDLVECRKTPSQTAMVLQL